MEHILVGIDGKHGAWEALARGCALTKRIDARLHVLLVLSPPERVLSHGALDHESAVRKRLELLIETAKSEGVQLDYFIAKGDYEEEIIRFVNHNRITLLVYEMTEGETQPAEKVPWSLQTIRHRIACKVEIVAPRKNIPNTQERTT